MRSEETEKRRAAMLAAKQRMDDSGETYVSADLARDLYEATDAYMAAVLEDLARDLVAKGVPAADVEAEVAQVRAELRRAFEASVEAIRKKMFPPHTAN